MYIFLYTVFLTIFVEFLVIWLFIRKQTAEILLYTILINCFTLPLATYGYNYAVTNIVLIEILVILTESLFIMVLLKIKYPKALVISAAANVASVVVGILI
jgi:hypothetical protein